MKIKLLDYGLKERPKRARYNDAGIDVRVCLKNCDKVRIWANGTTKVPLGFGVEIPDGYMGLILPRSSWASKGLSCEASPIDSGYRGEIHAIVSNHNNVDVWLDDGERIGQLVIVPCILAELVTEEELGKERGTGAFGSTNSK